MPVHNGVESAVDPMRRKTTALGWYASQSHFVICCCGAKPVPGAIEIAFKAKALRLLFLRQIGNNSTAGTNDFRLNVANR